MCLDRAQGLVAGSPGTPEAAEAQRLFDSYLKAEQARMVEVFTELEPELEACAKLWKQDKVFQAWAPAKLAAERFEAHPGGAYRPGIPACKDDGTHETCKKTRAQYWKIRGIEDKIGGYPNVYKAHAGRSSGACYAGEYEKLKPEPPDPEDMGAMRHSVE